MNLIINIIIAALASYGISSLLTVYDGPADAFIKLRQKLPFSPFTCTTCMSVLIAIPIVLFSGIGLLEYLAIIGIIVITEKIT